MRGSSPRMTGREAGTAARRVGYRPVSVVSAFPETSVALPAMVLSRRLSTVPRLLTPVLFLTTEDADSRTMVEADAPTTMPVALPRAADAVRFNWLLAAT